MIDRSLKATLSALVAASMLCGAAVAQTNSPPADPPAPVTPQSSPPGGGVPRGVVPPPAVDPGIVTPPPETNSPTMPIIKPPAMAK